MNQNPSIKFTATILPFLVGIALMLSCNAFAKDQVTQAELDAAVAAQGTVDNGQNATISAQSASITALQAEIANLKALIENYHPAPPKYKVGDRFGGGIIFYVDETGQHGLIVSLSDLDEGNGMQWYNGVNKVTGATGDGIGAGASNTTIIVAAQAGDNPNGNFAAKLAADFNVQEDGVTPCTGSADEICYGDWYLPSGWELLKWRQYPVGEYADYNYWSSTEGDADTAFQVIFDLGQGLSNVQFSYVSKHYPLRVRAIRAF